MGQSTAATTRSPGRQKAFVAIGIMFMLTISYFTLFTRSQPRIVQINPTVVEDEDFAAYLDSRKYYLVGLYKDTQKTKIYKFTSTQVVEEIMEDEPEIVSKVQPFQEFHLSFSGWRNMTEDYISNFEENLDSVFGGLLVDLDKLVERRIWIYLDNEKDSKLFEEHIDYVLSRNKLWDLDLWFDYQWLPTSTNMTIEQFTKFYSNPNSTFSTQHSQIIATTIPKPARLLHGQQPFQRVYLLKSFDKSFVDDDIRFMFNKLDKLQYPKPPNATDYTQYKVCGSLEENPLVIHPLSPWGMGASLHMALWPFFWSLGWNRTVVYTTPLFGYKACPASDLTCFFLPTTSCTYPKCPKTNDYSCWPVSYDYTDKPGTIIHIELFKTTEKYTRSVLLPPPRLDQRSKLWAMSYLGGYVFKPNAKLRSFLYDARKVMHQNGIMGFPNPKVRDVVADMNCMSMHVRHGDKGSETRLLDFSVYMKKAQEIRQIHHKNNGGQLNKIFLLTDDPAVLEQTKQYSSEFTFFWLNNVERHNASISTQLWNHKLNGENEAFGILVEMFAAATNCQYFIGTGSSNVGRFIAEEMVRKRGEKNWEWTWFSVDYAWHIAK